LSNSGCKPCVQNKTSAGIARLELKTAECRALNCGGALAGMEIEGYSYRRLRGR